MELRGGIDRGGLDLAQRWRCWGGLGLEEWWRGAGVASFCGEEESWWR